MTISKEAKPAIGAIIDGLYFQTADKTYIVARWCSIQRLSNDFIWNAIHALEKYLKAAILRNGGSVKDLSHDILSAYERLEELASDLLPGELRRPEGIKLQYWRDFTPKEFIEYLVRNGGAGVRYNEYGHVHRQADLFLLDELVFQIRRLCVDLERLPFKRVSKRTQRSFLKAQPDHFGLMGGFLEKLKRDRNASRELKQAAFNLNIRFSPVDFEDDGLREGTNASNSVLGRHIKRYLESDNAKTRKLGVEVRQWYFDNNNVADELRSELSNVKAKS